MSDVNISWYLEIQGVREGMGRPSHVARIRAHVACLTLQLELLTVQQHKYITLKLLVSTSISASGTSAIQSSRNCKVNSLYKAALILRLSDSGTLHQLLNMIHILLKCMCRLEMSLILSGSVYSPTEDSVRARAPSPAALRTLGLPRPK